MQIHYLGGPGAQWCAQKRKVPLLFLHSYYSINVVDDFSKIAKSQLQNRKINYKIVTIKCERPYLFLIIYMKYV